jgi:hypothetical protein
MKQEEAVREAMAVVLDCLEGCSGVSNSNDQSLSCLVHQVVQACRTDPAPNATGLARLEILQTTVCLSIDDASQMIVEFSTA